jgi:hypothetical protein
MVDAGKQHWELVAKASELTLYVIDEDEKPINTGVARSRRRFSWRAKCKMWFRTFWRKYVEDDR